MQPNLRPTTLASIDTMSGDSMAARLARQRQQRSAIRTANLMPLDDEAPTTRSMASALSSAASRVASAPNVDTPLDVTTEAALREAIESRASPWIRLAKSIILEQKDERGRVQPLAIRGQEVDIRLSAASGCVLDGTGCEGLGSSIIVRWGESCAASTRYMPHSLRSHRRAAQLRTHKRLSPRSHAVPRLAGKVHLDHLTIKGFGVRVFSRAQLVASDCMYARKGTEAHLYALCPIA